MLIQLQRNIRNVFYQTVYRSLFRTYGTRTEVIENNHELHENHAGGEILGIVTQPREPHFTSIVKLNRLKILLLIVAKILSLYTCPFACFITTFGTFCQVRILLATILLLQNKEKLSFSI